MTICLLMRKEMFMISVRVVELCVSMIFLFMEQLRVINGIATVVVK